MSVFREKIKKVDEPPAIPIQQQRTILQHLLFRNTLAVDLCHVSVLLPSNDKVDLRLQHQVDPLLRATIALFVLGGGGGRGGGCKVDADVAVDTAFHRYVAAALW